MLVYDVSRLPCREQVPWHRQHCADHAATLAADVELPAWEPFDAFAHHRHMGALRISCLRAALAARAGEEVRVLSATRAELDADAAAYAATL